MVFGVRQTSSLPSGPYCLVQGKVQYHVAGAEALKFGPELILFPLSVVYPLPTVGSLS